MLFQYLTGSILNNKHAWLNIPSPHIDDEPGALSSPHGSVLKQRQPAAANLSLVRWRVSDPAVISHDILSEIGPGQAESGDQPLFCFVCPFQARNTAIKTGRKRQRPSPLSLSLCAYSPKTAPQNASFLSTLLDRRNDITRTPLTSPPVKSKMRRKVGQKSTLPGWVCVCVCNTQMESSWNNRTQSCYKIVTTARPI